MNISRDIFMNDSFVLPFNEDGALALTIVIWILFVFGVLGNISTIVTVAVSKKLNSTWYALIVSLSVSDLMSALLSLLQLYNYTAGYLAWEWSEALCKVFWAGDIFTSYSTTLHVLSFATLRFISLQFPHKFKSVISKFAKKLIFVVWILAFVCGFIPFSIFFRITGRDRSSFSISVGWPDCGLAEDKTIMFVKYVEIAYPVFYYIPFVLIIVFSIGIGIKVSLRRRLRRRMRNENDRRAEKERRKERKIVLQLVLIVGSFMLGYFPVSAYHFYAVGTTSFDQDYWNTFWLLGAISFSLLRLSECLNPVFYNLASRTMRSETVVVWGRTWRKFFCFEDVSSTSFVAASKGMQPSTGVTSSSRL